MRALRCLLPRPVRAYRDAPVVGMDSTAELRVIRSILKPPLLAASLILQGRKTPRGRGRLGARLRTGRFPSSFLSVVWAHSKSGWTLVTYMCPATGTDRRPKPA
jgi:hypothetical protein